MKLSQLRYFQVTCQTGTTSKAAEILHISQPSVSAAIRELEQEFSVRLFSRESRNLKLTEEGNLLLSRANDLLSRADETEQIMHNLGEKTRILRIGVPPMIASLILPKLFSVIGNDLRITITERGRDELLNELIDGQLDFAFLPHNSQLMQKVTGIPLGSVETVYCVRKDHPLAGRQSISFHDLDHEKLILFKDEFFHTQLIKEQLHKAGSHAEISFETSQLSTMLSLIPHSEFSGFLFRPIAESVSDIIPISTDPRILINVSIFYAENRTFSREMKQFTRYISQFDSVQN